MSRRNQNAKATPSERRLAEAIVELVWPAARREIACAGMYRSRTRRSHVKRAA